MKAACVTFATEGAEAFRKPFANPPELKRRMDVARSEAA